MIKCIPKANNVRYNVARQISNSRFNYKPSQICFCYDEDDVVEALHRATPSKIRVRAGGHHHEGMCSGEDVLMLDVSRINHVVVDEGARTVRVGPGATLGAVYDAVLSKGFLFPGGACRDVHVGGLVQGGGWGLFARGLGLTCDWLDAFRMVTWFDNNGHNDYRVTTVRRSVNDRELFWSVCGGGGGNFGVATDFVFKIFPFKYEPGNVKHVTQFSATWQKRSVMGDVLNGWLDNFLSFDDIRLTTFCRLIAPGTEVSDKDKPSLVLGNFIGGKDELIGILGKLLPRRDEVSIEYQTLAVWPPAGDAPNADIFAPALYQAGAPASAADEATEPAPDLPAPAKLGDTCGGGLFRHKVSSAYPRASSVADFPSAARDAILRHVNATSLQGARRYISLHSLGGVVASNRDRWSCFAYREKPFLIQYQAWWHNPTLDNTCLSWIANFRDDIYSRGFTEGSFINFPDRDLVKTTNQKTLMQPYYGKHFDRLMRNKNRYDPKGVFDFPMGIPRN
jgi:FAD/FMN-containing dehydrogenase